MSSSSTLKSRRVLRLAIFASGRGSNAKAIIDAHERGDLPELEPVLLFSDKNAPALEFAQKAGLATAVLQPKDYSSREEHDQAILALMELHHVDLIALAGYMRLITKDLISHFEGRILNIHPALLPEFPGTDSIARAYQARVPFSGVTVHIVDEGMDTGPVLTQERVDIDEGMTLEEFEKNIHKVEHKLYPLTLRRYAQKILEEVQA